MRLATERSAHRLRHYSDLSLISVRWPHFLSLSSALSATEGASSSIGQEKLAIVREETKPVCWYVEMLRRLFLCASRYSRR